MKLNIVSPEKIVLEKEIESINIPTETGRITVLPNHEELVSTLGHGKVFYIIKGKEFAIRIKSGFLYTDGQKINLLIDELVEESTL